MLPNAASCLKIRAAQISWAKGAQGPPPIGSDGAACPSRLNGEFF